MESDLFFAHQFQCKYFILRDHRNKDVYKRQDQNAAVNTFPGLVHTARHTMGVSNARSQ